MKLALASDHAGYFMKEVLKLYLIEQGHVLVDFGTHSSDPVDYPDYIFPAARSVARGESNAGIVLGGSGNGEAMVANKLRGIRCAICWNRESALLAKAHNNANMIAIGARLAGGQDVVNLVETWLTTNFEGGRHLPRLLKMAAWGGLISEEQI